MTRVALFRAVFAVAIVFATVVALMPHAPDLPGSDKSYHLLAFATLALLAAPAYPATPLLRIGERLSFLGALIEVLQAIPALHRDCDIKDWVADTVAVAVVLGSVALLRRRVAI